MNPLYNAGIRLYSLAVRGAASMGHRKAALLADGQTRSLKELAKWAASLGGKRPVWVHAASLGEFEQGRPIIERLKKERPDIPILLTFFSPSGYEVRKNYPGADMVAYLPFDTPANAKALVDCINPLAAVFVKYEFWGNYLQALSRRNIPTFIVSAIFRPSQVFFKPWGAMFRKLLGCYHTLFVQDERSRELLLGAGIPEERIVVAGDTRFDRVTDNLLAAPRLEGVEAWVAQDPSRFTFIAGSSWEPDEDIFADWLRNHPEVRVIIAPHEFDEHRLKELEARFGPDVERYTAIARFNEIKPSTRVLLVDCYGLLATLYRYGSMAFIGGGFGAGIHSVAEAAVFGIPVVFGPRHRKFREACQLIECGGGFSIDTVESFEEMADNWLANPQVCREAGAKAGEYIASHIGASDMVMERLLKILG